MGHEIWLRDYGVFLRMIWITATLQELLTAIGTIFSMDQEGPFLSVMAS